MGRNPSGDPKATLSTCQTKWQGRDNELLSLVKKHASIAELTELDVSGEALAEIQALQTDAEELADMGVVLSVVRFRTIARPSIHAGCSGVASR